jgi:hypothetical protein
MTVAQYITHLQQFPQSTEVMRTWDELGSFHPALPPELVTITQHVTEGFMFDGTYWFEKGEGGDELGAVLDEKQVVKVGSP